MFKKCDLEAFVVRGNSAGIHADDNTHALGHVLITCEDEGSQTLGRTEQLIWRAAGGATEMGICMLAELTDRLPGVALLSPDVVLRQENRSTAAALLSRETKTTAGMMGQKGEKGIFGLTDTAMPHGLVPKGASKICRLSNLSKEDEVCQYAVRKPLNKKRQHTKKNKEEAAKCAKLCTRRMKQAKEKYQEQIPKTCKLSSLRASTSKRHAHTAAHLIPGCTKSPLTRLDYRFAKDGSDPVKGSAKPPRALPLRLFRYQR
ncbi:hypothetical protein Celaphus_00002490, partial [Cervus elaphus hippelaphus]